MMGTLLTLICFRTSTLSGLRHSASFQPCRPLLGSGAYLSPMSAPSPTLGAAGEQAATAYYLSRGYALEARNYRAGRAEIDLIVRQPQPPRLVFVEVKVRTDLRYGYPEEFVTPAQQRRIRRAAEHYLFSQNWHGDIRFDILSLTPNSQGFRVEAFEDAF